jgi:hypothetical protein
MQVYDYLCTCILQANVYTKFHTYKTFEKAFIKNINKF